MTSTEPRYVAADSALRLSGSALRLADHARIVPRGETVVPDVLDVVRAPHGITSRLMTRQPTVDRSPAPAADPPPRLAPVDDEDSKPGPKTRAQLVDTIAFRLRALGVCTRVLGGDPLPRVVGRAVLTRRAVAWIQQGLAGGQVHGLHPHEIAAVHRIRLAVVTWGEPADWCEWVDLQLRVAPAMAAYLQTIETEPELWARAARAMAQRPMPAAAERWEDWFRDEVTNALATVHTAPAVSSAAAPPAASDAVLKRQLQSVLADDAPQWRVRISRENYDRWAAQFHTTHHRLSRVISELRREVAS